MHMTQKKAGNLSFKKGNLVLIVPEISSSSDILNITNGFLMSVDIIYKLAGKGFYCYVDEKDGITSISQINSVSHLMKNSTIAENYLQYLHGRAGRLMQKQIDEVMHFMKGKYTLQNAIRPLVTVNREDINLATVKKLTDTQKQPVLNFFMRLLSPLFVPLSQVFSFKQPYLRVVLLHVGKYRNHVIASSDPIPISSIAPDRKTIQRAEFNKYFVSPMVYQPPSPSPMTFGSIYR